jgi:hypothetical protein
MAEFRKAFHRGQYPSTLDFTFPEALQVSLGAIFAACAYSGAQLGNSAPAVVSLNT